MKLLITFGTLFSAQLIFSQNTVSYSPSTTNATVGSGFEISVPITVTCSGSNPTMLVNIAPANTCSSTDGWIGLNFTNGVTALTPGQSTIINFRFKKTVTTNTSITYKFSNNGSCVSPQININVNYVVGTGGGTSTNCPLPAPTNFAVTDVQTTTANLSWNPVQGADFYRISHGSNNIITEVPASVNSYILFSLFPGTLYNVNIRAIKSGCPNYPNASYASFTTLCLTYSSPSNLSATPSGSGYTINFTPLSNYNGYYMLDYVNLSNNSSGSMTIYPGAYFYYVSFPTSFKFKIRPVGNCSASDSEWLTVIPTLCPATNYPSNLSFSSQSICGSTPGRCCGYGQFSWSAVSGAVKYEVEYMGVNLTNTSVPTVSNTFQTTSINSVQPTLYACNSNQAGTWILKYRVRSQCSNGTWSDFSPWSSNFAW